METKDNKSIKTQYIVISVMAVFVVIIGVFMWQRAGDNTDTSSGSSSTDSNANVSVPARLSSEFPEVDYSKSEVDLNQILSGGPGKDGIPALSDPEFEPISETSIPDTTRGILVSINDETKFYPYNILVWHEIVNDEVGGTPIAATFCPLCGSAVVYSRLIAGQEVEFGVSGFLWESNMVMYERVDNPTFWSQSIGKGIVGSKTGQQLNLENFQLLEVGEVKASFPEASIMTLDTGHTRNYSVYPYGDYDFDEELIFPVSVDDNRYSTKELFFIVPRENDQGQVDKSLAIRIGNLEDDKEYKVENLNLNIVRRPNGEIFVVDSNGEQQPGYYEMWFSWATHHQDDGQVFDPS